jgi:hypothetical protein
MSLNQSCTRHKNLSEIFFNNRWIDFIKHNTRIVKPALMLVEKLLHIVKDIVVVFREAFSIYPSVRPVIHPWMASYREENPDKNK